MKGKRVFISSYGAVTPAGIGSDKLIDAVFNKKSIISNLSNTSDFSLDGINSKVGGFCKIDENEPFFNQVFENKKDCRRMDKFLILAILAFEEAARKIDLKKIIENGDLKKERIGSVIGCGIGGLNILERSFQTLQINEIQQGSSRKTSPFTIPYGIINMASSLIAMSYDLRGPTFGVSSACASANHSVAIAYEMIKSGSLDMVIAGGTEAAVTRTGVGSFDAMRALSTKYNDNPEKASRPFDKNRDGFVISEGAGILILESEESIKNSNRKPLAEISGTGMSSLVSHITSPDEEGEGAILSMKQAVEMAKIETKDIGIINMHATSTSIGDAIEAKAIKRLFTKTNPILSATKSITGHMLGSIGAIELILLTEMLKTETVPGNLNLDDIDDFAKDMNISKEIQKTKTKFGISNSFGFGGTNASILLSKIDE